MKAERMLLTAVLAVNTLGLLAFMVWLALGRQRILYTQEGVLYILPTVPFIFVYIFIYRRSQPDDRPRAESRARTEEP